MTKYVLQSGGLSRSKDRGLGYWHEIAAGLGPKPKFLLCPFAQPRVTWESRHIGYAGNIQAALGPGIEAEFELANPLIIADQVKAADALYLPGGDDHLVMYWLRQLDLPKLWQGKVIGTNSGSSDAVCASFWTCDWRACMDGLGLLPIKFIPHYGSTAYDADPRGPIDWQLAKRELQGYGDSTHPIYALREGEYKVFEV